MLTVLFWLTREDVFHVYVFACFGQGNASPIENMSENEMDDYETKQNDQSLASKHDSKTETSRTSLPSIQLMSVLAENEKSKAQYSRKEDSIDEGMMLWIYYPTVVSMLAAQCSGST